MNDILTEKEAKTRWCPLARTISEKALVAGNRTVAEFPYCIASQCMAWRLAHKDAADGQERGYCGAFGTPRFT